MKLFFALLLIALFALIFAPYASGSSKTTAWCVDRVSVGISYPNSNSNPATDVLRPQAEKNYGNAPASPVAIGQQRHFSATVTAYNSVPEQTDGDPCVAADGTDICLALERGERACAANHLPFGTVLDIGGTFRCVVRDRTATRYGSRIDVYFGGRDTIQEALRWGIKKNLTITIIK